MLQNKEIMVIPKKMLFKDIYFEGFYIHNFYDFESVICNNHLYMNRQEAEQNPEYKQPIPYTVIINQATKMVFLYQRSKQEEHYKETRLQGKFSIGLGGHIEKTEANSVNPIRASLERELNEEVRILGYKAKPAPLGYINDESNDVGKVHFGILYYILTNAITIKPRDKEITNSKFVTFKRLNEICQDDKREVETWTKIALSKIERLLTNQP